jgi:hypothetical protein
MSNNNIEQNEKLNTNLSDFPDNEEYNNLKVANLNIDNDSKFNSALILDADKITPKNSIDSIGMKFSIDYAPKQRIHEYLNNDLINALDTGVSPQIPNAIAKSPDVNNNNNEKKNLNEQIPIINLNSNEENNINYNNPMFNQIPFNNNFNKMQILNNLTSHQIINKNENKNENENEIQMNVNSNSYFPKNYFLNNNNIMNNINNNNNNNFIHNPKIHHNNKGKKPFEIREGDWTCFHCNNLNFSFRLKCNRCGLSKELSLQKYNLSNIKNV